MVDILWIVVSTRLSWAIGSSKGKIQEKVVSEKLRPGF